MSQIDDATVRAMLQQTKTCGGKRKKKSVVVFDGWDYITLSWSGLNQRTLYAIVRYAQKTVTSSFSNLSS